MLLLTGASGSVGRELLGLLLASGRRVRLLVRDPRRLGPLRAEVELALADPAGPQDLRVALRGVSTVVHLGGTTRDRPGRTIEAQSALATWRLVRAAEQAGVQRVVLGSTLGASPHSPARFCRAKAVAEGVVAASPLPTTVVAPSLVYAPGDRWVTAIERLALLPVMPLPGGGTARLQPVWARDVAAAVRTVVDEPGTAPARLELAGPHEMAYRTAVRLVLGARGWPHQAVPVALGVARPAVRALEALGGPAAFVTRDELDLTQVDRTTARGTRDFAALGLEPRAMPAALES